MCLCEYCSYVLVVTLLYIMWQRRGLLWYSLRVCFLEKILESVSGIKEDSEMFIWVYIWKPLYSWWWLIGQLVMQHLIPIKRMSEQSKDAPWMRKRGEKKKEVLLKKRGLKVKVMPREGAGYWKAFRLCTGSWSSQWRGNSEGETRNPSFEGQVDPECKGLVGAFGERKAGVWRWQN